MAIYTITDSGNAVTNMANAQAQLNAMLPGDTLKLTKGVNFDGTLTLPAKAAGLADIIITTTGTLPAAGTRISPADEAELPKLRVNVNNASAIKTCDPADGVANGYRLIGLECIDNAAGGGTLINLGSASTSLANKQDTAAKVPGYIVVDRCYIHGQSSTIGTKRGIALHGHDLKVTECYIANVFAVGADTQAICGWNGLGGYTVTNNYLEAAGENFMMGGSDPIIPNLVPATLSFSRNDCYKLAAWKTDGFGRQVKNIFELKNFSSAHIYGNKFFYCWTAAQPGYPILFTPVNQDGGNNSTQIKDIIFEYNEIAHVPGGVNISAHDAQGTSRISARTQRITIRHNLFWDMGTTWGNALRCVQSGNGSSVNTFEGTDSLVIDHNTFIGSSLNAAVYLYTKSSTLGYAQHPGFICRNNLMRRGTYGFKGDSSGEGTATLTAYAPDGVFTKNVVVGASSGLYPTGNYFPTETAFQATFTDYAGGDYTLAASSPYKNAGTDGLDLGADIAGITAAYGATTPPPPPCTYVTAPTSVAVGAAATGGTLTVTTQSACAWTAVSNDAWITVTGGASGTGNGSVTYTVDANVGGARSGTLTVAGATVSVAQEAAPPPPPPPCTYSVAPVATVSYLGATGVSAALTSPLGCAWTAVSNVAWITLTTASGTGDGTVVFDVGANNGAARVGTITVEGETLVVAQDAVTAPAFCSYVVSPTAVVVSRTGGSSSLAVTTQDGCAWSATVDVGWITLDSSAGTGNGTVAYTVASNAGALRHGLITVSGVNVVVTQAAVAGAATSDCCPVASTVALNCPTAKTIDSSCPPASEVC